MAEGNSHLGPQFPSLPSKYEFAPLPCKDCGVDTGHGSNGIREYYVVQDDLWKKSRMKHDDGYLCVGCLEKRIGRQLHFTDFADYPVNSWPSSDRLSNRRQLWSNSYKNYIWSSDDAFNDGNGDE